MTWVKLHVFSERMKTLRQKLIDRAEAYCESQDIKLNTLSSRIANDGKLFDRIKNKGKDLTTGRYEYLMGVLDQLEKDAA